MCAPGCYFVRYDERTGHENGFFEIEISRTKINKYIFVISPYVPRGKLGTQRGGKYTCLRDEVLRGKYTCFFTDERSETLYILWPLDVSRVAVRALSIN